MGGQSKYTPALADEIVERLSDGEPLRQICRDDHMPSWRTVYEWMRQDEDFASRIARARDLGADAIAEEIVDIIDNGTNDWMEKLDKDQQPVGWQLNGEHVQRSKLRAEMRLKLLAKWRPSKYGDKTGIELTGKDGGPVELSDSQRAAKIATLVGVAQQRAKEAAKGAAQEPEDDDLVG